MRKLPHESWLLKLASLQIARPWLVVLVTLITLVPAGFAASQLTLRTSLSELLPSEKPSVVELQRVNRRLASASTLTVVAEGGDVTSLKRFVDALALRIEELDPELVSSVETGTQEVQRFFDANKHLYADLKDVRELHAEVLENYDKEVAKAAGMDLGLEDEEEDDAAKPTADTIEGRLRRRIEEAKKKLPGFEGYYLDPKTRLAAILVRTPLASADQRAFELKDRIQAIVDELNPKGFHPDLTIGYTGNLITSAEQQRAVTEDLAHVGVWGVGLILGIVFLFFLRVRTLVAMTLTIGVGCMWAFGVAKLTVGHLNTATGFLVSIIAGNGINFGIIYMARYIEARRDQKLPVALAIPTAHRDTYTATLSAAAAAAIAYGSLAATDFQGFKHFGIIGGLGMILCWIATYLFLPAFLVLTEKTKPLFEREPVWRARLKGVYGYPFAALARRLPRTLAFLTLLSGVGAAALAAHYFSSDPMEYDMNEVRNERRDPTSASRLSVRVDRIVGRLGQDGRAILTKELDQVRPLIRELAHRRAAAPPDQKPFDRVVSIYDLLPEDQSEKLRLLAEVKERLIKARKRGVIPNEDWQRLVPHIPEKLAPIGIADLPEQIARPFMEKDGTRGRIVYIVPTEGRSVNDARYLMLWADSFREVPLPDGSVVRGTGDPVIFADMLINIGEDAPKAITMSLIGTLLVILIAFRARSAGWLALIALLIGISWLVAFLSLRDIKLNFLNFVALPISIGVGADYAINVLKRAELEGRDRLYRVFVETGGAVVLCSLTTTLGYTALLLSINRAVQSFGLAAAVGEITTLLAAVLALPAYLFWRMGPERARLTAAERPAAEVSGQRVEESRSARA